MNRPIDRLNPWVQFTGGRRIHLKFEQSLAETTFLLIHEASHLHASTIDGLNREGRDAAYLRSGYQRYMEWDAAIGRGENPAGSEFVRNHEGKLEMQALDPMPFSCL